jgi:muramoyltetrapeptide carboxypeptidase
MVLALDGGYGAARLYPHIDWDNLGEPRIFCGYSDITALHLALAKHGPWTTFYSPTFLRFTRKKDELTKITEDTFHRALKPEPLGRVPEDPDDPYVLTVCDGVAEAPIVGGCLTLVASSLGTPYEIETDGCILMLEDLNEEPYMIDAHLNHLILAGKLDNAAGLVFGTDVNLKPLTIPEYVESSLSIEEILDELIAPLGIPAIANVPVGHGKTKVTIPLSVSARLDATNKTLDIVEAGVT